LDRVIGVLTFIIQPGIVQGIVATFGFTEQQAGWVAAAEMGGLAVAAGILALWTDRINWHRTLRNGAPLAAGADLASAFAHGVVYRHAGWAPTGDASH
jgi:predicted MFS family arabinose efflux permease